MPESVSRRSSAVTPPILAVITWVDTPRITAKWSGGEQELPAQLGNDPRGTEHDVLPGEPSPAITEGARAAVSLRVPCLIERPDVPNTAIQLDDKAGTPEQAGDSADEVGVPEFDLPAGLFHPAGV